MKTDKLLIIMIAVVLLCLCGVTYGVALDAITEGFNPGGGQFLDVTTVAQTSTDTGYSWSGYHAGWGFVLADFTTYAELDFSGEGTSYDNWNAWTVFNGDYVTDLKEIRASWHSTSSTGNLNMKALIQDASGNWFVSDDVTSDAICCNPVIDATATTWKILTSDPVINTALSIGSASAPDLTKVYGGGLLTVGVGTGAPTRLDSLTFTNQISGTPPSPTIYLDKSSYYSTEDITITWTNAAGNTARMAKWKSLWVKSKRGI